GVNNLSYTTLQIFVNPQDTTQTTGVTTSHPFIGQAGQEPYTWVRPQKWPDYLSFDTKTGLASFTKFTQKTFSNQDMHNMAHLVYTVTVSSKLEDNTQASTSAPLSVEVRDINAPYQITYRDLCLVINKN